MSQRSVTHGSTAGVHSFVDKADVVAQVVIVGQLGFDVQRVSQCDAGGAVHIQFQGDFTVGFAGERNGFGHYVDNTCVAHLERDVLVEVGRIVAHHTQCIHTFVTDGDVRAFGYGATGVVDESSDGGFQLWSTIDVYANVNRVFARIVCLRWRNPILCPRACAQEQQHGREQKLLHKH